MKQDLAAFLAAHREEEKASFHMPGHKGMAFFARLGYGDHMQDLPDMDVTEIPGADDLRHADGYIRKIADDYSEFYGSRRSFISVNGSSALIMAAIMSAVKEGRLIAAANSHISVVNGAKLSGADVVFLEPSLFSLDAVSVPGQMESGKSGISREDAAAFMDRYEDAVAVIIPSPDYLGVVSDVSGIAEEAHKRGMILIVDQAHGAHLMMFSRAGLCGESGGMPVPAEELGADIVIDSTHKTTASFTQSAVANIFGDKVDTESFEEALLTLESTSPSYILMDSLALNAEIMKERGEELALSWKSDLDFFYDRVRDIKGVSVLTGDEVRACGAGFDRTKLVIDFSKAGISGKEAEEKLMKRGVFPEFSSGSVVLCMTGIGNVRADYELLLQALMDIAGEA